jgi:hypothetical protein
MPNLLRRKWLRRSSAIYFLILLIVAVGGIFLVRKLERRKLQREAVQNSLFLPSPRPSASATKADEASPQVSRTIAAEYNLDVPFTSQAPTGNWDHQHEENCEEASLLMANRFFTGRPIEGAQDAEDGMAQIVEWEDKNLGVSDSIDAEQVSRIIKEFLNLKSEVITNPSASQIRQAIFDGKLVLMPASGRELNNPFFKQPGPVYHMLVIKGYTTDKFITNDPGTRHGDNYVYNFETLLNAGHDWNSGDVSSGRKAMILVSK